MKILMFCSNPVNGGTARIFYELVTAVESLLTEEDVVLACVNEKNSVEIYKRLENLHRLPVYSAEELFPNLYGGNIVQRLAKKILRKIKYSSIERNNIKVMEKFIVEKNIDKVIIHNGGYVGDDLCNQMLTAAYRAKCVSHQVFVLHNDMEKNVLAKIRYRGYDRTISKEATEIVTVSEYTKKRMMESSFIKKEIKVIYNGLTINKVMSLEEKQRHIQIKENVCNVLMIGNFAHNKGQKEYIKAANELLKESNFKFHFSIIGNIYDKSYYEECMQYIEEQEIQPYFTIYQGIHNAYEYIDMFDMLVVPSMYDESFGLISLEAMANERPVVAFACGGIPEVVQNERNGFVVPLGDWHRMAESIKWLVKNPEMRIQMGKNGRIDYEGKFSVKTMAKQYMSILS